MDSKVHERYLSELLGQSGLPPRLPWTSPLVRDLAWSIGSPPLVCPEDPGNLWPGGDWFRGQLSGFTAQLDAMDRDAKATADLLARSHDQRLGTYFESLLALWLEHDPRYELLARNLPVRQPRKGGGRETLGELDMLVMNHALNRVEHWEVAVKFYLGRLPVTGGPAHEQWVGPGLKDRLDTKVARLLDHQLRLPEHPRARALLHERGLKVAGSRVFMKGRLFYPLTARPGPPALAAPEHLRGWWLRIGAFPGPFKTRDWLWRCLSRREWLAPVAEVPGRQPACLDACSFARTEAIQKASWPRMVVALSGGRELTRGFLVPDSWGTGRAAGAEAAVARRPYAARGNAGS